MKVFALSVLLISIYYVEGGLVKRQAEEEPQSQVPNSLTGQWAEFIRRVQQDTEGFASTLRERFGQATVEDFRTQFETAFQQFQDSFKPLTEQLRQNVGQFITLPGQAQQATEEGV